MYVQFIVLESFLYYTYFFNCGLKTIRKIFYSEKKEEKGKKKTLSRIRYGKDKSEIWYPDDHTTDTILKVCENFATYFLETPGCWTL